MHPSISITKKYTFEAAHHLPGHEGKCARPHGHSYKLEVTISGDLITEGSSEGMVIDFKDLSHIVNKEIVDQWDHQDLNVILPFRTTVENIAKEAFDRLIKNGLSVTKVVLWETATACATIETRK